jgi:hypothetical protein
MQFLRLFVTGAHEKTRQAAGFWWFPAKNQETVW